MMRLTFLSVSLLAASPWAAFGQNCAVDSVGFIPLNDLGGGLYLNRYEGGLYPGGMNTVPSGHALAGVDAANTIQPLNQNGLPSPSGRIVMLSIGMSNTRAEFDEFVSLADSHPSVNRAQVRVVNGAINGQDAPNWVDPQGPLYELVRETILEAQGLSAAQVQVVWIKLADGLPSSSLPNPDADAFALLENLGDVVRAVRVRYPNAKLVFLSSRIYAGYATTELNPEPYAYESGFAVKWLIEAQINQANDGLIDPVAGDLKMPQTAPWLAWGPYLWADGETPRSDGLTWQCEDLRDDGTHPSRSGVVKVANELLDFFLTSPMTQDWFSTTACPPNGDVNGSGGITPYDALLVLESYLDVKTLSECQKARGDVDGSPNLTPNDALEIFNQFLEK